MKTLRIELEEKIKPYWIDGVIQDLAIGDGWLALIDELVDSLAVLGPFQIAQIKEKFGSLRFYTGPLTNEQTAIVRDFEALSAKTCERCGEPGEIDAIGYWLSCLCKKDRQQAVERRRASR
jgi:hypothetical protein